MKFECITDTGDVYVYNYIDIKKPKNHFKERKDIWSNKTWRISRALYQLLYIQYDNDIL